MRGVRYLVLLVMLIGCSGRPAPGDACVGDGMACGAVSNNDRLLLVCDRGTLQSVGTCQKDSCAEVGDNDSLACDGVRYAVRGAACNGSTQWACKALGGEVLTCLSDRWVTAARCDLSNEMCVPNVARPDGGLFVLPGDGGSSDGGTDAGVVVPPYRCHGA